MAENNNEPFESLTRILSDEVSMTWKQKVTLEASLANLYYDLVDSQDELNQGAYIRAIKYFLTDLVDIIQDFPIQE